MTSFSFTKNAAPLIDRFINDIEAAFKQAAMDAIRNSLSSFAPHAISGAAPAARAAAPAPGAGAGKRRSASTKRAGKAPVAAPQASGGAGRAEKKDAAGSHHRRTTAEIEATTYKVLSYIKSHPGLRGEHIKKALGLSTSQWLLPIGRLVDTHQVVATGHKRSTTYTTADAPSAPTSSVQRAPASKAAPPAETGKSGGAVPPIKRVRRAS